MSKEPHLPACSLFSMPFHSAVDIPCWTLDIRGGPSSALNAPLWAKKFLLPRGPRMEAI